jgi:hypothetical protein
MQNKAQLVATPSTPYEECDLSMLVGRRDAANFAPPEETLQGLWEIYKSKLSDEIRKVASDLEPDFAGCVRQRVQQQIVAEEACLAKLSVLYEE